MPFMTKPLAEIEHHLGPLLKKLELRTYCAEATRNYYVTFEGGKCRETWGFAPIELAFPHKNTTTKRSPAWKDVCILESDYSMKKLGDTGFVHRRRWKRKSHHLGTDNEKVDVGEVFAMIKRMIRKSGKIIELPPANFIENKTLADIFWYLDGRVAGLGICRIDDPAEEPSFYKDAITFNFEIEALTFLDQEGRRVHIGFASDTKALIYVDGEIVEEVQRYTALNLGERVLSMSGDTAGMGLYQWNVGRWGPSGRPPSKR